MLNAKIGETIKTRDGRTTIGAGEVVAITLTGDYIVQITETSEHGAPLRLGDLYQIDKEWDFYVNANEKPDFFTVGGVYRNRFSTPGRADLYTVMDLYEVGEPSWPGAAKYALATVKDPHGRAHMELLDLDDFGVMVPNED